jgi:SAM-dependent methyltransferase
MKRGQLSIFLRKLGLIYYADWLRFYVERRRNKSVNEKFLQANPGVKLPPDYLIYESFKMNYSRYYDSGRGTALELAEIFGKYIELKDKRILDWGCGPGRVIRHLPEVIGNNCEYFATDYNEESISWCRQNLLGIHFNNNSLEAKLPYKDNTFDVIYGISIFTHLSEKLHYQWYDELFRILRPGGIMYLTTHGDNFKVKLTGKEIKDFEEGHLIVRGYAKEGHRTFAAFQPAGFMLKLFHNVRVLEHIETPPSNKSFIPQDEWVVQKQLEV